MASYLAHTMEGRARLRHPVLGRAAAREKALAVLSDREGVVEARPGASSLLLLLAPGADLDGICRDLEAALPDLLQEKMPQRRTRAALPSGQPKGKALLVGLCPRKLELRVLLGICGLSIALGLAGRGRAHALTGAAFGLLATRHVWTRRGAL